MVKGDVVFPVSGHFCYGTRAGGVFDGVDAVSDLVGVMLAYCLPQCREFEAVFFGPWVELCIITWFCKAHHGLEVAGDAFCYGFSFI